ncbi:MAG: hypothetical protein OJF49_004328 [Ktedonobacterales bacterium]|jgi:galactose-1-phosphate uridylyltransferase|nr:MAG: hypothetical protein OJF49_004328 [Ktedonobacterales bacterium]
MPIQFERREKVARYVDAQTGEEHGITCELRRDPLTGHSGRVAHVLGFRLHPVDFAPMIEASRHHCPFCPERILSVTPRFPAEIVPEGRIHCGEAVVFPNLAPYDQHSAVVAMTHEHYVPLSGFSDPILRDSFAACLDYFRAVQRLSDTPYALIFWNYLPASGGTQIHPHLQAFVTDTPGNALEDELAAGLRYYQSEGRPYWNDLVHEEVQLGERFIARGSHTVWLTSFVSQSLLADTLVIFPERRTATALTEADIAEFCIGLGQTLRHFETQGIYSFNLALFSATPDREDFRVHARISPRVYMTPRIWGTDTSALQHLYGEHFMVRTPEAAAQDLRAALNL